MNPSSVSILPLPVAYFHRLVGRLAPVALLFLLAGFGAHAGEPSLHHTLIMRGQILEVASDGIVLCVGERDGAKVGQVLDVLRHVRVQGGAPKQVGSRFRREQVGRVEIQALFDEHYARAAVVEGNPVVHDVVELERK